MAVTGETLRLLDGLRLSINGPVDATVRDLIVAWGAAWNEVAAEWDAAIVDLLSQGVDGRWPSPRVVRRADRARRAMDLTRERLKALSEHLPVRVLQDVPAMTVAAADWQARLMASQLPPQAGGAGELSIGFNRLDPAGVDAIVKRTTRRITALSRPLAPQAEAALRRALIRGITVGDNPRRVATDMLARVQGAFDGGRVRALVIARTEMLDAHRAAARANDLKNADTLTGWQWVAQLDQRTCASCWSQHGSMHALDEAGPMDHQQGRCVGVPITKSWRDLGFDLEEPASLIGDAKSTFDALPASDRVAIMGRDRLTLLDSGQVSWSDLSTKRSTPGWRDSYAPTPIRDLRHRPAA